LGFDLKGYLVGASSLFNGNELRPVFHLHAGHKSKSGYVSTGSLATDRYDTCSRGMSALLPKADKIPGASPSPLSAMSGCEQSQQGSPYSITSSAHASSVAASSSRW
jgi:hypothetical protein